MVNSVISEKLGGRHYDKNYAGSDGCLKCFKTPLLLAVGRTISNQGKKNLLDGIYSSGHFANSDLWKR